MLNLEFPDSYFADGAHSSIPIGRKAESRSGGVLKAESIGHDTKSPASVMSSFSEEANQCLGVITRRGPTLRNHLRGK